MILLHVIASCFYLPQKGADQAVIFITGHDRFDQDDYTCPDSKAERIEYVLEEINTTLIQNLGQPRVQALLGQRKFVINDNYINNMKEATETIKEKLGIIDVRQSTLDRREKQKQRHIQKKQQQPPQ
jgi:hypothetical protein